MINCDLIFIRPPAETKILQKLNSTGSDLGDYLISKLKHLTKTSDLTKLRKKWKFRQSENEISTIIDQSQSNIRSRDGKYIFVYLHPKTDSDSRSNLLKFLKFRPRSRIGQLRNQKVTFSLNKNKFQQESSGSPKIMVNLWLGSTVLYRAKNLKILKYDFYNPDQVKAG